MSKRYFSLLHGGDVHIAPGIRTLPAKAFSTLLTADEALKRVQADAKQYRLDVAKECEPIKEQAYREGFEEGFRQWTKHLAELEAEIRRVHDEVQKAVVPLALSAAKKIVGREIALSPETTVDIVATSLKAVSQHKRIMIYVNRKDLEVLDEHKGRLKAMFEHLESLSIRERADIEPGGCIIETEAGIINAQIANKWQALEEAFASLLGRQGS